MTLLSDFSIADFSVTTLKGKAWNEIWQTAISLEIFEKFDATSRPVRFGVMGAK